MNGRETAEWRISTIDDSRPPHNVEAETPEELEPAAFDGLSNGATETERQQEAEPREATTSTPAANPSIRKEQTSAELSDELESADHETTQQDLDVRLQNLDDGAPLRPMIEEEPFIEDIVRASDPQEQRLVLPKPSHFHRV